MILVWVFALTLNLSSFGGDVRVTVETSTEDSCWKLRQTILREFGGEGNFKGLATVCVEESRARP